VEYGTILYGDGADILTVALQVVENDEKGSLESEVVKYGHE
jgi:hypothetical protein